MPRFDKYQLYELSVQDPAFHIDILQLIYSEINNKKIAHHLREDFCGTFAMSSSWVKWNKRNTAVALDLDVAPLKYGKRVHLASMTKEQRSRLIVKRQNVFSVTKPAVDIIGVGNFSFYCIKERKALVEYFRFCLKSLRKDGVLVLEMAGGPGMIEKIREQKTVKISDKHKFKYFWDQKSFDPVTRNGHFAIHFEFRDGTKTRNVFHYDWRLWTIPEVQDALVDAGFKQTCVYWDVSAQSKTSNYVRVKRADNDYAWVAQIVGMRK